MNLASHLRNVLIDPKLARLDGKLELILDIDELMGQVLIFDFKQANRLALRLTKVSLAFGGVQLPLPRDFQSVL